MASARPPQLNIRSDFVRRRTDELVRRTGMTATLVIEEALRSYIPATPIGDLLPPGFVRKGRIIVGTGRHRLTVDDVQASIDESRNGDRD